MQESFGFPEVFSRYQFEFAFCLKKEMMAESISDHEHVFYGKTWYYYVTALLMTMLAAFASIMGPLFLFGIMKRADGKPGTDAGTALSIMAIAMLAAAILAWLNVLAHRKPMLKLCNEGMKVNLIGALRINGATLLPSIMRVAFGQHAGWIPWSSLRSVDVGGMKMVRSLTIDGSIIKPTNSVNKPAKSLGERVTFRDAEFRKSLDDVAASIQHFARNPELRKLLPKD
jgi:hypothetical protein